MLLKPTVLASVLLCALLLPGAATAGELPAVSGPNGKLSVEGGTFDDEAAGLALGSFSLPLGHNLGVQFDGAVGNVDGDVLGGGGVHLFTRDPSSYLLGVYGSYHTWDSIDIWRIAAEAELYLGRFTVSALAGYENIDVPSLASGLPVLTQDEKSFFGIGDVAYYINDDFKIYGGYRYVAETSLGAAGAEYLLRDHGVPVSLFARGDFGNSDFNSITGGVKIYLSDDRNKSLIDRNRRDDPEIYVPVFPKVVTQTAKQQGSNQCVVGPSPDYKVASNFSCTCPSGTPLSGQQPQFIPALGGFYTCGNPV
ncbi:hypothetical protein [Hyphomicrobium sulfonivorans]|uniref:hypothetical protein n=1 Tax=Hyphomicrobium sulfonivorans TaxID=121290 RepID=UPI000AADAC81|nr:hypothetical protein [Hyphomicrobium sulfonivorans]